VASVRTSRSMQHYLGTDHCLSRAQWGLWNEGQVTRRENGSAEFTPLSGGVIDSGLSYAVTSFVDTKNNASRRIQWGWANEENNNFALLQAGYQGAISTILVNAFVL
jgi:beta-fructofuranosidase